MRNNKLLLCLVMSLGLILSTACVEKTATVGMAEDMQVTMKSAGYQPPPRGVDDIIKLLETPIKDNDKLAETRKLADEKPPADKSKEDLAYFYYERGVARSSIGRSEEARKDFYQSFNLLKGTTYRGKWATQLYRYLWVWEWRLGRIKSALNIIDEITNLQPSWNTAHLARASIYAFIGDVENAKKNLDKTLEYMTGVWHTFQDAWLNAYILDSQGKYEEAELLNRRALEITQSLTTLSQQKNMKRLVSDHLSRNLMLQGRLVEAEVLARDALKVAIDLYGYRSLDTMNRALRIGQIIYNQKKYTQAIKIFTTTLRLMKLGGVPENSPQVMFHTYELANALLEKGDLARSFANFKKIYKTQSFVSDYQNSYLTNTEMQTCYLQMNKAREILSFLHDGHKRAHELFGADSMHTALLAGLLGVAHNQLGDRGKAYQYFSKSIPIIRSNPGRVDQTRKTILEGYLDLLHWIKEKGQQDKYKVNPMNESFMAADMMRTKSTSYALNQSLARTKAADPGLGKLVRDEQDLELQIKAYWGSLAKLAAAPKGQEMPELASRLRGTISDLQAQRKGIRQELENRYPRYGALVKPPAQGLDAIRALLASGESLIAIHPGLHRTYLWAGAKGGKAKFMVVELGRKELDAMVSKLKSSLTKPNITTYHDIPAYDFGTAHALYTKLLKPLADIWQGNSKITLLADGSLGELPFEVLITKPYKAAADQKVLFGAYREAPWLANQVTITRLPAASSLQALRRSKAAKGARRMFAGFGNPVFSQSQAAAPPKKPTKTAGLDTRSAKVQIRGVRLTKQGAIETTNLSMHQIEQLSALPDTEDEIKSVARALKADPKQDLFLGKKASERVVKTTRLDNRKVLAFATHALLPGDLSGLDQSALALSSPRVTGENEDGLLTMGEVMTLKLASDLVILSGCSTGAASSRGAEAISGLGRAFFYAGSKGVMVTMWPVETASAGKLVSSVFEYKQDSLSQSLNAAKLNMIQKGGVLDQSGNLLISYAHPIFWAPYVFVGDANSNAWK